MASNILVMIDPPTSDMDEPQTLANEAAVVVAKEQLSRNGTLYLLNMRTHKYATKDAVTALQEHFADEYRDVVADRCGLKDIKHQWVPFHPAGFNTEEQLVRAAEQIGAEMIVYGTFRGFKHGIIPLFFTWNLSSLRHFDKHVRHFARKASIEVLTVNPKHHPHLFYSDPRIKRHGFI